MALAHSGKPQLHYALVIATRDRADALQDALKSISRQSRQPELVVIVDSSDGRETENLAGQFDGLKLEYRRAEQPSAARQRNLGSDLIESPLVAFCDDDVVLEPDVFEKLCSVFEDRPDTGGVAARMRGAEHRKPTGALWWYYRLQAGFADKTYGARLFGPAINCFPCYGSSESVLIPADWLNLGCVAFRTDVFRRELFPDFEGYSHMEDVHLSARVGKTHRLFFHRDAWYDHYPSDSAAKRDRFELGRMRIRNQRRVATEIMGQKGLGLEAKLLLHRLFISVYLARFRPSGWRRELQGIWK